MPSCCFGGDSTSDGASDKEVSACVTYRPPAGKNSRGVSKYCYLINFRIESKAKAGNIAVSANVAYNEVKLKGSRSRRGAAAVYENVDKVVRSVEGLTERPAAYGFPGSQPAAPVCEASIQFQNKSNNNRLFIIREKDEFC